jgi:hypothetical protein
VVVAQRLCNQADRLAPIGRPGPAPAETESHDRICWIAPIAENPCADLSRDADGLVPLSGLPNDGMRISHDAVADDLEGACAGHVVVSNESLLVVLSCVACILWQALQRPDFTTRNLYW